MGLLGATESVACTRLISVTSFMQIQLLQLGDKPALSDIATQPSQNIFQNVHQLNACPTAIALAIVLEKKSQSTNGPSDDSVWSTECSDFDGELRIEIEVVRVFAVAEIGQFKGTHRA